MPRIAHDAMQDVLSKSAEARKIALSLKHVEYGGELVEQVMAASSKMETLHGKINDLQVRKVDDDAKYGKLVSCCKAQTDWFDKAKVWF